MGVCAEETASKCELILSHHSYHINKLINTLTNTDGITREQQDAHAIQSYKRSAAAWEKNLFAYEIVPVSVKSRKGETVVDKDEEFTNVKVHDAFTSRSDQSYNFPDPPPSPPLPGLV